MRNLSSIISDIKVGRYQNHAFSLSAAPEFLYHHYSDGGIPMDEMIIASTSKPSLDRKVSEVLRAGVDSDFYDYSLVLGKFTGVYNVYDYQPLSHEVKRNISYLDIDPKETKAFLDRQFHSICKYFQDYYHIHADRVQQDIARMFHVGIDDSIYSSPICRDVGKMLVVSYVTFRELESDVVNRYISSFIENGDMVSRFENLCFQVSDENTRMLTKV